jgi:hypothetical protein
MLTFFKDRRYIACRHLPAGPGAAQNSDSALAVKFRTNRQREPGSPRACTRTTTHRSIEHPRIASARRYRCSTVHAVKAKKRLNQPATRKIKLFPLPVNDRSGGLHLPVPVAVQRRLSGRCQPVRAADQLGSQPDARGFFNQPQRLKVHYGIPVACRDDACLLMRDPLQAFDFVRFRRFHDACYPNCAAATGTRPV